MKPEELDRIKRAEDIQWYTENRCEALEKENAALKEDLKSKDLALEDFVKWSDKKLNKAKKIIGNLYAICKDNHYPDSSVLMEQAEQFLKED